MGNALLDAVPSNIMLVDPESGTISFINQAALAALHGLGQQNMAMVEPEKCIAHTRPVGCVIRNIAGGGLFSV
jgi:hypothetical protein